MKEQKQQFDAAVLQEKGGARVQLQPRRPGESLKAAKVILKKRHRDIAEDDDREKKIRTLKRRNKNICHKQEVKSAQHFVKRGRQLQEDIRRCSDARPVVRHQCVYVQRDVKKVAFMKKTPAPKPRMVNQRPLLLIVRNHREGGSRDVRNLLKRLGIVHAYNAIFLRNDEQTQEYVRLLRPFVFYGFPTYQTLRRLFLTRGRLRMPEGKETAELTDNLVVEKSLGHLGILCVEDLLHEIWNCGQNFDEIKASVCSFQLSNLKKAEGLKARRHEFGDLKDSINEKIWKIA